MFPYSLDISAPTNIQDVPHTWFCISHDPPDNLSERGRDYNGKIKILQVDIGNFPQVA
jgi:hypothetical protein